MLTKRIIHQHRRHIPQANPWFILPGNMQSDIFGQSNTLNVGRSTLCE